MTVSKIKISNFRGIDNIQTVPLSRFSSIIGKNDSGKSIVLNALASYLDVKSYPIVESDFNDLSKEIIIECSFIDDNLRDKLENKIKSKIKKADGLEYFLNDILIANTVVIQKKISKAGKAFSEINILIKDYVDNDFSFLYEKDDNEISHILSKYNIEIPVEGKGRNSKLEKIQYIKEHCEAEGVEVELKYILDEYKIDTLLPSVELFVSDYGLEADTKFKTNSVSEIQEFFINETRDDESRLKQVEKDIQEEMNKEADLIKNYMSDYTSDLNDIKISPTINWKDAIKSVDVSFQFEGDSKPIPMTHKGTGYRRLFMVARFRYLAEKNKGQDVIYLIEEPETFLHPSAQEDLLNSLTNLSEDSQIVITTHSPVFAGHTNYESLILCQKNTQSIYSNGNSANKIDFIHSIVDEIGIRPYFNLVDTFEKILFVESNNDADFYDILSKKILEKGLHGNEKILILPFGGESIDSFINIDYFDKSNRDLFLIIDSDKQNTEQKQEVQKSRVNEFNERNKGNAYLLNKSCIENYYHPRAIERLYGLEDESLMYFIEEENVKITLNEYKNKYKEDNGIQLQFSSKNNMDIFNNMTKEEWEEIVETELIDFIKSIHEKE